jgi:hypothetical protein
MSGYGKKRLNTAMDFNHGSRIPSTTPIRDRGIAMPTPFSRENDPTFSCVTASLANLVWEANKHFANWVAEGAPRNFRNLREVANFLQHAASSSSDSRVIPFRVVKCLPPALQSLSPRDSFYQNTLNEKCRERLDWILEKESGSFLVVVVASDSHANHVIGVDASRRLIYDHEIRNTLPLSQESI